MASDRGADRAIAHMNADHQREMTYYLRHYCGLSARAAAQPTMTALTLTGMTLQTPSAGTHTIPFTPPLASPAEIRPRVITMANTAREALGISDVYVTKFLPPQGVDVVVAAGVALYFVCYFTLPFVTPESTPWTLLDACFPAGGALTYVWVVRTIFWPVVLIHGSEGLWFHRTRMVRHGVEPLSALWWKWQVSTWFEGLCAFKRIDGWIEQQKKEKAAKKH